MAEPFLGEIRLFPFNFAPNGWLLCNGQLLPINQNSALFSLLGTNYGGNGTTTFGLPNLQGSVAVHPTQGENPGQAQGEETHVLTINEVPQHTHQLVAASGAASTPVAAGNAWAATGTKNAYAPSPSSTVALSPNALAVTGGGQGHSNMQPYTVGSYCIATRGIFPSRP